MILLLYNKTIGSFSNILFLLFKFPKLKWELTSEVSWLVVQPRGVFVYHSIYIQGVSDIHEGQCRKTTDWDWSRTTMVHTPFFSFRPHGYLTHGRRRSESRVLDREWYVWGDLPDESLKVSEKGMWKVKGPSVITVRWHDPWPLYVYIQNGRTWRPPFFSSLLFGCTVDGVSRRSRVCGIGSD